jgi:hypothetical protein
VKFQPLRKTICTRSGLQGSLHCGDAGTRITSRASLGFLVGLRVRPSALGTNAASFEIPESIAHASVEAADMVAKLVAAKFAGSHLESGDVDSGG